MVQFNLLPDIKKKYIQAKRTKRLIVSISGIIAVSAIGITVLLFTIVQIAQKKNIDDLSKDISSETTAIQSIEDLNQILTIQNQLETLPALHQEKPETSRLFNYLYQLTPEKIKIQEVNLQIEGSTLKISGSADSLASINQYVDTLKFATYKTGDIQDGKPFDAVTAELTRSEDTASYRIEMTFDPILFDNTVDVKLVVPKQITTRSITGRPGFGGENSLFEDNPNQGEEQ